MKLIPIDPEILKQTAGIIGPHSAAARALADAAKHNGPVRFWRVGQTIVVEKQPPVSEG